jgi:hypothetical protein
MMIKKRRLRCFSYRGRKYIRCKVCELVPGNFLVIPDAIVQKFTGYGGSIAEELEASRIPPFTLPNDTSTRDEACRIQPRYVLPRHALVPSRRLLGWSLVVFNYKAIVKHHNENYCKGMTKHDDAKRTHRIRKHKKTMLSRPPRPSPPNAWLGKPIGRQYIIQRRRSVNRHPWPGQVYHYRSFYTVQSATLAVPSPHPGEHGTAWP